MILSSGIASTADVFMPENLSVTFIYWARFFTYICCYGSACAPGAASLLAILM